MPKGTLGNLTPADRHGSVQVRSSLLCKCFLLFSLSVSIFCSMFLTNTHIHTDTHSSSSTPNQETFFFPLSTFLISHSTRELQCHYAKSHDGLFAQWQTFELFSISPSLTTLKLDSKIIFANLCNRKKEAQKNLSLARVLLYLFPLQNYSLKNKIMVH